MTARTFVLLATLILVGGGAWLLHERLMAPLNPEAQAIAQPEITPLPAIPSYDFAAPNRFSQVTDRPLFSETRRPPDADAEPEAAAEAELGLQLQGIIVSGATRLALVREIDSGQLLKLKRNDSWRGWRLSHIGTEAITFSNGAEEQELTLDYQLKSSTPNSAQGKPPRRNRLKQSQVESGQTIPAENDLNKAGVLPAAEQGQ